jgi:hypothetical protein
MSEGREIVKWFNSGSSNSEQGGKLRRPADSPLRLAFLPPHGDNKMEKIRGCRNRTGKTGSPSVLRQPRIEEIKRWGGL